LQQQLLRSMKMRGVTGPVPVVAFAAHTADPAYRATSQSSATLRRGELVMISLAARVDKPDTVFAALTGMAIADDKVPATMARAFEAVTTARDLALATLAERKSKRPGLKGFEIDAVVRGALNQSGFGKSIVHASGHSLDTMLQGHGADLDDTTMRDNRTIMTGTGFAVGPGLYFHGEVEFGVRAEVSVFATSTGIEVTTPAQDTIELLLK
jgi:Xaa-Pro aminopeptidase